MQDVPPCYLAPPHILPKTHIDAIRPATDGANFFPAATGCWKQNHLNPSHGAIVFTQWGKPSPPGQHSDYC